MIEIIAAGMSTIGLAANALIWQKLGALDEAVRNLNSNLNEIGSFQLNGGTPNARRNPKSKSMD